MIKKIIAAILLVLSVSPCFASEDSPVLAPRLAIVPDGEPKPVELLTLAEAKLFELGGIEMVERNEIDKVFTEQKRTGLFGAENALQLGKIFRVDLFAVLEPMSIIVFDAKTGLRYADETLPENLENALKIVVETVENSVKKREKLKDHKLETYGILEIRNADFPIERDAWCKAVAGMLERQLLRSAAAVLERSRLGQVDRERKLTGEDSNNLLASMKLIDLEFKRGKEPKTFRLTARIDNQTFQAESLIDKPLDAVQKLSGQLIQPRIEEKTQAKNEAKRFLKESRFLATTSLYELALEKAEVGAALAPNNIELQKQLYLALVMRASDMTYLGSGYGHRHPATFCAWRAE